ncbi:MAG: tetratricopeptide repeat protein, partial [Terriglobales bacterium]
MIPKHLSHYRVLEKIGSGGMGVVYRAQDETLDRDVALKVLPTGMLSDESARRRFRREALSLAKLNHPNIGGIYEFGSEAGVDFLAMELVSGLTLEARLCGGPLEQSEVLRHGAQLADGLEAAHQQGILHRDLKPSNLRINKEGRLKILDFGLAEWTNPEGDSDPTVTNMKVSGTVAYMSPEQLRGKNADVRSDLYAAGAVLYEMATGKHPYAETSGPQLIAQILDQAPLRPTSRNRRISPALEAIILKALDHDPNLRYQSAQELRIDLERLASGTGTVAIRPKPVWPWIVAAAVLVLAGILAWNLEGIRARMARSHAIVSMSHGRRAIAVMGFRNLSGRPDEAWLSTALAEMLSTELSSSGQLRTLPGENIARMKLDLALPDSESYASDTLSRIRKHSGTDLVVLGSYLAMGKENGDQLRVDFRVQDTVSGETLASVSETGTEPELLDLVARTGSRLRGALGIQTSAGEASSIDASLPSGSEAARLYAEGLSKLRVFEALAAKALLEKAVALDPKHALSHAALSDALTTLGDESLAREEAQKALDLSANLSREDRFIIEGRLREVTRDWPKAIETYRTLWQFFPDNPEYALRLAAAQTAGGKGQDALGTLAELRKSSGGTGEDPRVDIAESRAQDALGSFEPSLASAQRAIQIGQSQGARLIVAQAKIEEGWAFERLGKSEKSESSFREAHELFSAAGDRRGAAVATLLQGNVFYDRGDFAGAIKAFEESLQTFREMGDLRDSARALNSLGNVDSDAGKFAEARNYYEQTLKIDRETEEKSGIAGALGNLANVYDGMGDLQNARKMNEQGLAAFREIGDQRGTASTLGNLCNVLVEMGELTEARQRCDEGLKIQKETGYRRGQAYAASNMADLLTITGDLPGARKMAEEGLAIREELGESINTAFSQQQMGLIALSESHAAEAEGYLRKSVLVFQKADIRDNIVSVQALLVRALVEQGKPAEAAQLLASLMPMAESRPSYPPRFDAALAAARVDSANGKFAEAIRKTQEVRRQASRYGYV